ncbi:ParA family protein [Nocardioides iriomotensis]|uniref:ParA family protein n=1 Tax=Nocardioides iriomotensis TaxID=715784 RepID=A0A4Q5J2H0_9ACTN|nr:ParA family protein [Nocardioides iriomotensis]RYU12767.1 ParA family protein [Nocardioides iriomotensis]
MALYALASAKGAPGTTVTALALATVWPTDPVVADMDPAGSDLTWWCRTREGDPLDVNRGLLSLGAGVRRGADEVDLDEHLQDVDGGIRVLAGVASPGQVAGLGAAWSAIPAVYSRYRSDVIADCGRVVPGSASLPVLQRADAVLFVVRPTIEGMAHLRERLRSLREVLETGAGGVPIGVAVVTSYRDTRSAPDLQQLLDSQGLRAQVLGVIADDDRAADSLRGVRWTRGVRKSLLFRSAAEIAGGLQALAGSRYATAAE